MVLKRDHREADVKALGEKFRRDWNEGEVIRSWLRRHGDELRSLVRQEDWSWANIGKALSRAGIQFRTGNGWTGENVRRAVDLAMRPKKARAAESSGQPVPVAPPSVAPLSLAAPLALRPAGEPEFKIIQRGPGSAANRDAIGQSRKGEP